MGGVEDILIKFVRPGLSSNFHYDTHAHPVKRGCGGGGGGYWIVLALDCAIHV